MKAFAYGPPLGNLGAHHTFRPARVGRDAPAQVHALLTRREPTTRRRSSRGFVTGTASIVEAGRIVSFEERASQYLAQGAIQVLFADGEHVAALCEGYSKTHRLGFEPHRGWWCSCHIQGECPHLIAVRSVVGT